MQVALTWDSTGGDTTPATAAQLLVHGVEKTKDPTQSQDGEGSNQGSTNGWPFRIGTATYDVAGSLDGEMGHLAYGGAKTKSSG